jgi:hypothetical protein
MNENYYQYALKLLDELTLDELEAKLVEYGFNPRRKVSLFDSDEIYGPGARAHQASIQGFNIPQMPSMEIWAANDNSYALAA